MNHPQLIRLYDNTLRDGEQTVGVSFSREEKILVASRLVAANIRAFEAGFASVSAEEQATIKAVMDESFQAEIFSLARLRTADIDAAHRAGVHGITLIAPASDLMLRAGGRASAVEVEKELPYIVDYAKRKKLLVKFSCMDASRTPLNRLIRWYHIAKQSGADAVSYADTLGVATPENISRSIREMKRVLQMPVSMHAHNDLGLAVANSLAAVFSGADEIQVTVNGLGERAGNTPVEELVLALRTAYGIDLGVDLEALMELSQTVIRLTGLEPGANKPVIGRNAFRHESGIHVQGLLQDELHAFEPFPPQWIGRKHEVAFGKHSGKSNLRHLCREYGIAVSGKQEEQALHWIKSVAQKQKRELEKCEVLQNLLKSRRE